MNVKQLNELLSRGEIDREDMWPRIVDYESKAAPFRFEFGLDELPRDPGLIVIRGARQMGKSTWLDLELRHTIAEFGKATAFYLNGDDFASEEELEAALLELDGSFARGAAVRRIFVDEVTAVPRWEKAVKRLWDRGNLRRTLVVTTGSKATDLRRGAERLPGRKGRLPRTDYVFLPISYREFRRSCGAELGDKTWIAYLLAGGVPLACNDIYQFERIPEYYVQLTRDWVLGEIASTGRSRVFFSAVVRNFFRYGGSPVGYAKLARESGLANNTVASGYVEQLSDLLCVLPCWEWSADRQVLLMRKPCKFQMINLAFAMAFHPSAPRHVHEIESLPGETRAVLLEWLVTQEVWRRAVLAGREEAESIGFWKSETHEIDVVTPAHELIEVKLGRAGPLDFTWFPKVFPKRSLTVVCENRFQTDTVTGVTIEDFLMSEESPSTGSTADGQA